MNKLVNKFLLPGDTFMSIIRLRQLRLTYSTCGPYTKKMNDQRMQQQIKERIGLQIKQYNTKN